MQGEILSEQYPSDAAAPEDIAPIPQNAEAPPETSSPETQAEAPARGRPRWIAPAWFFFGVIVGIAGFAAYNALIVNPPATTAQVESLDPGAVRVAARQGVLEAIATLQAGGGQPAAQEPQGPQEVASNAFTVREANRQGNAAASVTVFEFSDFQ
jgi:hypothetical protein